MQIPNEAVHAALVGEDLRRLDPVQRPLEILLFDGSDLIVGGVAANKFSLRVADLKNERSGQIFAQVVIDDGSGGWIVGVRDVRRNGRALIAAGANASGVGGTEEMDV